MQIPKPTKEQADWLDCEIGVIAHLDLQVFEPTYHWSRDWGYSPSPEIFQPKELNTDQWLEAAKDAGATYAILTAKHCTGFSLWPTKAHDFSVASSSWRGGKGDIVKDFIASCHKYNIRPGLYCSAAGNAYLQVRGAGKVKPENPAKQTEYNNVVIQQLTELWTQYGDLFEIWFDGGVLPVDQGGPDLAPILHKHQPRAMVFQGPEGCKSLLRWMGNEDGDTPSPCWSTLKNLSTGQEPFNDPFFAGDPDGHIFCPAEAGMPNRDNKKACWGGWFWGKNEDQFVYSSDYLLNCYEQTVGRNSNHLLGMVIDDRGLVPDADHKEFRDYGEKVKAAFAKPVASTSGEGKEIALSFDKAKRIDCAVVMENIREGERVRKYVLEGLRNDTWHKLAEGQCIGHKRIQRFEPTEAKAIRLRIEESAATPIINGLSVY